MTHNLWTLDRFSGRETGGLGLLITHCILYGAYATVVSDKLGVMAAELVDWNSTSAMQYRVTAVSHFVLRLPGAPLERIAALFDGQPRHGLVPLRAARDG